MQINSLKWSSAQQKNHKHFLCLFGPWWSWREHRWENLECFSLVTERIGWKKENWQLFTKFVSQSNTEVVRTVVYLKAESLSQVEHVRTTDCFSYEGKTNPLKTRKCPVVLPGFPRNRSSGEVRWIAPCPVASPEAPGNLCNLLTFQEPGWSRRVYVFVPPARLWEKGKDSEAKEPCRACRPCICPGFLVLSRCWHAGSVTVTLKAPRQHLCPSLLEMRRRA